MAHHLDFIVVGSTAALAHGIELVPGDIDIVPALHEANLNCVVQLLTDVQAVPESFGYWITRADGRRKWIDQGISTELLAEWRPDPYDLPSLDHLFRTPFGNLDIVPSLAGTYEELDPHCVTRSLAGVPVRVPPVTDLIERLRYSNRAKDLDRLARLAQLIRKGGS